MIASGLPTPAPVSVRLMLDTGSGHTVLDPAIVDALGLAPSGKTSIFGVTDHGRASDHLTYDVGIVIFSSAGKRASIGQSTVSVLVAPFSEPEIDGVIGRDMMRLFSFNYQSDIHEALIYY